MFFSTFPTHFSFLLNLCLFFRSSCACPSLLSSSVPYSYGRRAWSSRLALQRLPRPRASVTAPALSFGTQLLPPRLKVPCCGTRGGGTVAGQRQGRDGRGWPAGGRRGSRDAAGAPQQGAAARIRGRDGQSKDRDGGTRAHDVSTARTA